MRRDLAPGRLGASARHASAADAQAMKVEGRETSHLERIHAAVVEGCRELPASATVLTGLTLSSRRSAASQRPQHVSLGHCGEGVFAPRPRRAPQRR